MPAVFVQWASSGVLQYLLHAATPVRALPNDVTSQSPISDCESKQCVDLNAINIHIVLEFLHSRIALCRRRWENLLLPSSRSK